MVPKGTKIHYISSLKETRVLLICGNMTSKENSPLSYQWEVFNEFQQLICNEVL